MRCVMIWAPSNFRYKLIFSFQRLYIILMNSFWRCALLFILGISLNRQVIRLHFIFKRSYLFNSGNEPVVNNSQIFSKLCPCHDDLYVDRNICIIKYYHLFIYNNHKDDNYNNHIVGRWRRVDENFNDIFSSRSRYITIVLKT